MAIVQLQKMQIFILQNKARKFLAGLQELGCFDITNVQKNTGQPEDLALRYQKAVRFLDTMFPRPRGFIENFIQIKPLVKQKTAEEFLKKQPKELLAELEKLQSAWEEKNQQIPQLSEAIDNQSRYANFGLTRLKKSLRLQKTKVFFGSIPVKAVDRHIMQIVKRGEKTAYVQVVSLPEEENILRDKLHSAGFEEINLPLQKQDYIKEAVRLKKELAGAKKALAKIKARLEQINKTEYARLAVWIDYLTDTTRLDNYTKDTFATEKTSLITGWVPVEQKEHLQKYLKKFSKEIYWREVEPDKKEIEPVILRNKAASPLESVTAIYGMPNNREFDPSPLIAPFFVLFYGVCLSDAGYGVMLIIFAWLLLSKFRANLTQFGKQLLTLNIYCGFATILMGFLTGSFFGLDFNLLPWPAVKDFLYSVKIFDPLNNPLPMLGLALGLGALHILAGLAVRFALDVRRMGWLEGFLTSGCWVIFVGSIFAWAVLNFLPEAGAASDIAKNVVFGGILFMILTQGRHKDNIIMKLGSGLASLYRLSGYLSDMLSYSRLFALGLVTAVLSMVVNYLAALPGSVPFIGFIFVAAIFIFGHTLDFLLNLLSAFVHSARLQYVEYFSKFFEGGGRFFKPFARTEKYVSLVK